MSIFLPLVDQEHGELFQALRRIGPVVLSSQRSPSLPIPEHSYILAQHTSPFDLDQIISWLDGGAEKVIVPLAWAKELIGIISPDRLVLFLDVGNVSAVSDRVRSSVSGVLLKTPAVDLDLISSISKFFASSTVYILSNGTTTPSISILRELSTIKATLIIPTNQLTLTATTKTQLNIAEAFTVPLVSDRKDGLFPTIVTNLTGQSLGLVYSSKESVRESITTGKGVYYSRKHGLWRKGETSGATQDVFNIYLDCDSDALEFRVLQHGVGFCHLNRHSCFREVDGLSALENTLRSRFQSAPEGSYTRRLFNDPSLLRSKIMEEADELCRAEKAEDVAFEAADLLYFALTKCIAAGVGIVDIEKSLDKKAKRVTRRSGDAKPEWSSPGGAAPSPAEKRRSTAALDARIRMRTAELASASAAERRDLLRRPVLRSDEMITKVTPIVADVRKRGDAALIELTAKHDKAVLASVIISPPFATEAMQIEPSVREAIDIAYSNIRAFHEAQADRQTLVVETMPGVVCSRFARPIARVGLYVPGGTAILPSTALMLGIPAQVAGCQQIVLATPPRPDGSISPEVMYVAKLVGASAILKAGGAQAIAAMAYGTETVPKVDKIFGPGNQWVMAAKMLVQNDTDALVSIDMPAGPSEVLVCAPP